MSFFRKKETFPLVMEFQLKKQEYADKIDCEKLNYIV